METELAEVSLICTWSVTLQGQGYRLDPQLQLLHWLLVYQRRGGDVVRDDHEPGVPLPGPGRLDKLQVVQPPLAQHTPLIIDQVQGQTLASPQHSAQGTAQYQPITL